MDEGCLFFILEAFGSFLFELLGHAWLSTWDFSRGLGAWLYREGPAAVRLGACLGAVAGLLGGLGLGFRFCPDWVQPPALFSVLLTGLIAPLLGLAGGLTGWVFARVDGERC